MAEDFVHSRRVEFNLDTLPKQQIPGDFAVKNPLANSEDAGDMGSILGLGRFPGMGSGNPLQYSCLGNPKERGDGHAAVHGVTKSETQLSD